MHVCPSGAHHCAGLSKCLICSRDSDLTSAQPPQCGPQPRSLLTCSYYPQFLVLTVICHVFFFGKYGFSFALIRDFPLTLSCWDPAGITLVIYTKSNYVHVWPGSNLCFSLRNNGIVNISHLSHVSIIFVFNFQKYYLFICLFIYYQKIVEY